MNSSQASETRPLNRSTPLARELVHRIALAEVLLTDVRRDGEHVFGAAAQWPRSHPTFDRAGDGRHNPLLVAETMRELGICIPLRFYEVPPDSRFLIEELRFAVNPAAEPRARYGGSEITCEVRTEPPATGHRPGRADDHPSGGAHDGRAAAKVQRLGMSVRYFAEGREFARSDGIARFLTPSAYTALRSRHAPSPQPTAPNGRPPEAAEFVAPDPASVGLTRPQDMLIGLDPDGRTRLLAADPYHPFFFDHYSDHVPGMVLIEAVRQAAVRQSGEPGWRIAECTLRARCFTELSPPAEIACTLDGTVAEFEIRQSGNQTAAGTLRFGPR